MIRFLRLILLVVLGLVLLVMAMANRAPVTLRALPDDMVALVNQNWTIDLPLFTVFFGGIAVGLLIGFVWEWFREHKHRATASAKTRDVARLKGELASARNANGGPQDEILTLLSDRRKAG